MCQKIGPLVVQFSVRNEGDDGTHGELDAGGVEGLVSHLHGVHPASPILGRVSFGPSGVFRHSGMVLFVRRNTIWANIIRKQNFNNEISTERF